jgi:hypothetical protein
MESTPMRWAFSTMVWVAIIGRSKRFECASRTDSTSYCWTVASARSFDGPLCGSPESIYREPDGFADILENDRFRDCLWKWTLLLSLQPYIHIPAPATRIQAQDRHMYEIINSQ